jgi:hypothetical protein
LLLLVASEDADEAGLSDALAGAPGVVACACPCCCWLEDAGVEAPEEAPEPKRRLAKNMMEVQCDRLWKKG